MGGDVALDEVLADAFVAAEVFALRPDYRAALVAADGLRGGPSDDQGADLLERAGAAARIALEGSAVDELPHVAAWREAYRAFGAKPQRTRNSLEALLRRAASGLPRVNRLTDLYNAVSVLHQLPLGGEDLGRYRGPARLVRANGDEPFDTVVDGAPVLERPDPGEVVWRDDSGVTCRRWNWRQCRRTALREDTTAALFVLDALAPMSDDGLRAAVEDLAGELKRSGGAVRISYRIVRAPAQGP